MPFDRLAQPCWVLDPEGGPGGEDMAHWDTESAALADVKDRYPPKDYPDAKLTVICCPEPCWMITCDGVCGERPEDDEYGSNLHCVTRAEAEEFAASCYWIVTRDGGVFCPDDAPDCAVADLAVIEQIPGQLTLDGQKAGG